MSADQKSRASFSTGRRWQIGFDVLLRTVLVLAVMGMVNYLATKFVRRFYLSSQTQMSLSSRTLAVLHTVTNRVDVTLYYDTRDENNFYPTIVALLDEYRIRNSKISVRTVDYNRDPGEATKVKDRYRQYFSSQVDKDLVIFDCGGRVKVFPGTALLQYKDTVTGMKPKPGNPLQKDMEVERKPVQFNGELAFTSMLLGLANPQPLKAYFLQGHREPSLVDSSTTGYQKFASVLQQNYISITNLDWLGNTGVPMDCNLLVIAGPAVPLQDTELQQIDKYLSEGGRMLVLFNFFSVGHPTGLEQLLQKWGVFVLDDFAQDAFHTRNSHDIIVDATMFGKHPVVDSLSQVQLQLYQPRPIFPPAQSSQAANAPQVSVLFGTSAAGTLTGNSSQPPQNYPLACAVEQKPVAGVTNPRGTARLIVVGDDIFWGNWYIDSGGNRDFLNSTLNWLCDRPMLLAGIAQRPVTDFRLQISEHQERQLDWLLLGALPGGALLFGWLVWFVRRK